MCLDETSKHLIRETRTPIATRAGQPSLHDYEYELNGTANIFMLLALKGWRRVVVTGRRAALDYAQILKDLADIHFPEADKIVLVQDNLSTKRRHRFMQPSSRLKRAASSSALNGVSRQSTAAE